MSQPEYTGTGTLVKDSILSVKLSIYYSSWFGDSLSACKMHVYELNKKLNKNRYTSINPEEYYDPNTEDKNIAEVIVAKQRNGPLGTVKVAWLSEYTTYANLAPEAGGGGDAPF